MIVSKLFRKWVHPCPHYIIGDDSHSLCVIVWVRSMHVWLSRELVVCTVKLFLSMEIEWMRSGVEFHFYFSVFPGYCLQLMTQVPHLLRLCADLDHWARNQDQLIHFLSLSLLTQISLLQLWKLNLQFRSPNLEKDIVMNVGDKDQAHGGCYTQCG